MKSSPNVEIRPARVSCAPRTLLEARERLISWGRVGSAAIATPCMEADVARGSIFHSRCKHHLRGQVPQAAGAEWESTIDVSNTGIDHPASWLVRGLLMSNRYGMANQIGARVLLHERQSGVDAAPNYPVLFRGLQAGLTSDALTLDTLDAGLTLVLGLWNMGLSRLHELRLDFDQAPAALGELCLAQSRRMGAPTRRQVRAVDHALAAVIGAPTRQRASGVGRRVSSQ